MNLSDLFLELLIVITLVAIVAATLFLVFGDAPNEFEQTCTEAGGKTVFDGRQYQCIKSNKESGHVPN